MGTNTGYKWLVAVGALFALCAFFLPFFNIDILGITIGVSLSTGDELTTIHQLRSK